MNEIVDERKLPTQIMERYRGRRFVSETFSPAQMLAGVIYYLHDKGITRAKKQHHIIRRYVIYMQWEISEKRHILNACILIQEDFPSFTNWFYHTIIKAPNEQSITDSPTLCSRRDEGTIPGQGSKSEPRTA
jgi:hypothetical protein